MSRSAGLSGLLPEGWLAGPMPWVIAVMACLAALSLAAGLALDATARELGEGLSRRATVQIVTVDAGARARQAAAALARLKAAPQVAGAKAIGVAELDRLLAPWLGPQASRALPLPAMIDVELRPRADVDALARLLAPVAPDARVDRHDAALAPLAGLVATLRLLAGALGLLMTAAMAAVIVLAAQSALDTHRGTVEILHLLGATDGQVARLFARRLAVDALFGAILGVAAAAGVLVLLGRRLASLDSGLAEMARPGSVAPVSLALLAPAIALLAMAAARATVHRALRRAA